MGENGDKCRVGFIGLGAMGGGMAGALVSKGFDVCGFDIFEPAVKKLEAAGGRSARTCFDTAEGAEVLVVMVTTAQQADSALFGTQGAVEGLSSGAAVVLCSTVPPEFAKSLGARLADTDKKLLFVDAPVSGGVVKAAAGTLTIMASGSPEAMAKADPVLKGMSDKLYKVGDQPGFGSAVKMVNQLLAGVHIAAAAEAMALGARAGLNTRMLYDIISHAAGNSWMFENRVPHMLDDDYTPRSALNIFVKDLGIVLGEGQGMGFPTPLASTAHQQFLSGAAVGLGKLDDASVVKVYERLAGIRVAAPHGIFWQGDSQEASADDKPTTPSRLNKAQVLSSLPPEWPGDMSAGEGEGGGPLVVVLDDDPTGTQTVHGIDVITKWDEETLEREMRGESPGFFILTNSRALPGPQAEKLTSEICHNLLSAAKKAGVLVTSADDVSKHRGLSIILRGDSTLRGHFPGEMEAVADVMGESDAWLICPFFLEGGRYTIDNVHYVAQGDELVPAGETEFAKDAAFGYQSSDLTQWVEEKTKGAIPASLVHSISLKTIRTGGPKAVASQLNSLPKGCVCIINAASNKDLQVVTSAIAQVEKGGRRFLCRSAASLVSARLNIIPKPPLGPSDFPPSNSGGLIVVGSYVPKTTQQVSVLLDSLGSSLHVLTIDAEKASQGIPEEEVSRLAREAEESIRGGRDTVILTSRTLITAQDAGASLAIGQNISKAVVQVVQGIRVRPKYVLAKGGITSSDVATKGLNVDKALVCGQAMPGVPLWELGPNSNFPGLPYIVFPGNVGGPEAVADVVRRWRGGDDVTSKTKSILKAAESGGYAVGAFNVYNLEGVRAVVRAAECEQSPAILQLHPAAIKLGGAPLVSACVTAAANAKVPVSLHLDHGTDEAMLTSAFNQGFDSVMVDGSALEYSSNVDLTTSITQKAHSQGLLVEAELGRIAGVEDDVTVQDLEARMTSAQQAEEFISSTRIDALAVCVGNRHGPYSEQQLKDPSKILDLVRLKELRGVTQKHGTFLVLHGASGLPQDVIKECVRVGVRKFNVNTEVRRVNVEALSMSSEGKDLADVLFEAEERMVEVIKAKLKDFGSSGKAV